MEAGRWRWAKDVLWRRSFDRVVVLPEGAGEPLLLEGSAAAIWLLLEQPAPVGELLEALGQHDAPGGRAPDLAAQEVQSFLRQLEQAGALERR